jgi:hypothetical protein
MLYRFLVRIVLESITVRRDWIGDNRRNETLAIWVQAGFHQARWELRYYYFRIRPKIVNLKVTRPPEKESLGVQKVNIGARVNGSANIRLLNT